MNAPSKANEIKAAITAAIAYGSALWGGLGWMIIILLSCIFLDYLTGTFAALKSGKWSSASARQGLWHKLGEIFALLVAGLCDIAMQVIVTSAAAPLLDDVNVPHGMFTLLVSIWYIFTELGSIIENSAELGAPVPAWLRKAISTIRDKADPDTDSDYEHTEKNNSPDDTGEEREDK